MSELTFTDVKKNVIPIENHFKGYPCFITVGGPSLKNFELDKLNQPGIMTFGVNNSPSIYRPKLWTFVDDPDKFLLSIWQDPTIMKFSPHAKNNKYLFNSAKWREANITVGECPNVVYYHRNEHFQPDKFLSEKTVNWGNHKSRGGTRSVFLAAIKICYLLGFRTLFLVGCDFKMEMGKQNYAFSQERTKASVNNNNKTYQVLNERFDTLRPIFEENNFFVFNCTPNSGLKSFPFIDFNDAIDIAKSIMVDPSKEETKGLYEKNMNDSKRQKIKNKLDEKRKYLNICKKEYERCEDPELKRKLDLKVKKARRIFREVEKEKNRIWGIKKRV